MTRKVIQVPVDTELLNALDALSARQSSSRAEIIRHACRRYLAQVESEALDRTYREGYLRIPETTDIGNAQIQAVGEILPQESWK